MTIRYTNKPPTKAGWYWMKFTLNGVLEIIVEVVEHNGILTTSKWGWKRIIKSDALQWAGP